MDKIEAAKTVQDYWSSISDLRPHSIFLSNRILPCTAGRLKYAHFVFAEALVVNREMSTEMTKVMMESYGLIESLFREDPEPDNIEYRKYIVGLENGTITNFRHPNPFGEFNAVAEFYNFIGESIFKQEQRQINDEHFGSSLYDALTDKAFAEKDIKRLIDIVNTSLTRFVTFPDKKSNDFCMFIN